MRRKEEFESEVGRGAPLKAPTDAVSEAASSRSVEMQQYQNYVMVTHKSLRAEQCGG